MTEIWKERTHVRSDLAEERRHLIYLKAIYTLLGNWKKVEEIEKQVKRIDALSREGVRKFETCVNCK